MITTVLAFLLTLGVLIVVHEYGHYRVAVACGVKVLRFSVGFGRVLWRRQRDPTAPSSCSARCRWAATCACSTSARARCRPGRARQAFNRKPLAQRAAIVAAGPLANLVLAVLLYAGCALDRHRGAQGRAGRAGGRQRWPSAPACAPATGCAPGRRRRRLGRRALDDRPALAGHAGRADAPDAALQVSDRDGRGARTLLLPWRASADARGRRRLMRRVGLGRPSASRCWARSRPAARPRGGLRRATACCGRRPPVADAQTLRERIRARQDAAGREPCAGSSSATARLELDGHAARDARDGDAMGRIDAFVGQPPRW
jgi:regulator of sigma E protease